MIPTEATCQPVRSSVCINPGVWLSDGFPARGLSASDEGDSARRGTAALRVAWPEPPQGRFFRSHRWRDGASPRICELFFFTL